MRGSKADIPVLFSPSEGTIRSIEWGGMIADIGTFQQESDPTAVFRGLPNDRCPVPHWGYIVQGQVRFQFADREEVYHAGDLFYVPPGHIPMISANTEWVEFSPAQLYEQTREVMARNIAIIKQQCKLR